LPISVSERAVPGGGTTAARPQAASPPVVALRHVSKSFGGVQALIDVDFDVLEGEVHCLAGENGCGKSTLIKIISGVHAPEPGAEMHFAGEPVDSLSPVAARHFGIQVIWQDLALFPEMSVLENIAFEANLGPRPKLVRYGRMRAMAARALDRLGVDLPLDRPLRDLGIAQRQVVAISRALVADARLVFMDEPTASLTQAETEALFQVVRRLKEDGIATVFVSHRLAEVLAIAERVTVLRDGRKVGVYPAAEMTQNRLAELMTGQAHEATVMARDRTGEPVVIRTEGLTRHGEYENVSLEIRRGEVLGLTGLLGAGRTELASTLFGLTRPERGSIELDGRPLRLTSNRDAIRAGIAYVSEDRLSLGLVQPQPISSNIAVTVLDRLLMALRLLHPGKQDRLARGWIERLKIKVGDPGDAVATLSGGNQQRVVLAKWLAIEPRVLILDSPTVGVDIGARAGIFRIVRELADAGLAILMISDEIPELYHTSDRILHMRDGRIVGQYRPGEGPMETIEDAVHA
jgi:simple sugar transport system ATP-binding protein